jgi:hypothetical protein
MITIKDKNPLGRHDLTLKRLSNCRMVFYIDGPGTTVAWTEIDREDAAKLASMLTTFAAPQQAQGG